jgi:hypothetical protein
VKGRVTAAAIAAEPGAVTLRIDRARGGFLARMFLAIGVVFERRVMNRPLRLRASTSDRPLFGPRLTLADKVSISSVAGFQYRNSARNFHGSAAL